MSQNCQHHFQMDLQMASSSSSSSSGMSAYEITRQRNIERNMAFLQNIGLGNSLIGFSTTQSTKVSKSPKKVSTIDNDSEQKVLGQLQDSSRRSTRIAAMNSIGYNVSFVLFIHHRLD